MCDWLSPCVEAQKLRRLPKHCTIASWHLQWCPSSQCLAACSQLGTTTHPYHSAIANTAEDAALCRWLQEGVQKAHACPHVKRPAGTKKHARQWRRRDKRWHSRFVANVVHLQAQKQCERGVHGGRHRHAPKVHCQRPTTKPATHANPSWKDIGKPLSPLPRQPRKC